MDAFNGEFDVKQEDNRITTVGASLEGRGEVFSCFNLFFGVMNLDPEQPCSFCTSLGDLEGTGPFCFHINFFGVRIAELFESCVKDESRKSLRFFLFLLLVPLKEPFFDCLSLIEEYLIGVIVGGVSSLAVARFKDFAPFDPFGDE